MIKNAQRHRGPADIFAIISGLIVAQLVATIAVRHSNLLIMAMSLDLQAAGWQPIPTGPVLEMLPTIGTAARGGLFFTLSIGAGAALCTWVFVRLTGLFSHANRNIMSGAVLIFAAGCLFYINSSGITWFPSAIVAAVILTTGLITARTAVRRPMKKHWWAPVLVLLLVTGLWVTQFNREMFISIRDHLLLSNNIGSKINNFYYKNTLYAAEVFKSFNQKTLRTCRLTGIDDPDRIMQLTKHLARWNVLVIDGAGEPDLTIEFTPAENPARSSRQPSASGKIALITRSGHRIDTNLPSLTNRTKHWLSEVSAQGDTYAAFRNLTFWGLLIGFPILLYFTLYTLLRILMGLFFKNAAPLAASALCLFIGVGLLVPVYTGSNATLPPAEIDDVLRQGSRKQRIAALRQLENKKAEIADHPGYRALIAKGTVVERYYLARLLAWSRDDRTYSDLIALAADPHINVICQAYYAMGKRGKPAAKAFILSRIRKSPYWYTQFYGYNALRKLGWRQTASKHRP